MLLMENVRRKTGVRRARRRFPIQQDVRYEWRNGSRILTFGTGQTLEISSREVRFTTQHTLGLGERVRLAMNWPALLDSTCPLKLEIDGCVVQSEPGAAAIKIERHEFRTRGSRNGARLAPLARRVMVRGN